MSKNAVSKGIEATFCPENYGKDLKDRYGDIESDANRLLKKANSAFQEEVLQETRKNNQKYKEMLSAIEEASSSVNSTYYVLLLST